MEMKLQSSTHSVLEADLRVNAEEMLMASAAIRLAIELAQDGSDYLIPEGMSTLDLSTSTDALNNFMRAAQQSDGSLVADSKIDSITDPIAVDQQRSVGEDILFIFEPGVYLPLMSFLLMAQDANMLGPTLMNFNGRLRVTRLVSIFLIVLCLVNMFI